MSRYASKTDVPSDRSRAEIERTLRRYGADAFSYAWDERGAAIGFRARERFVRFRLPLPDRADRRYTHTPGRGLPRAPEERDRVWDQDVRQRWRALALAIKAKLEAVDSGITDFESEFLAHILLPDRSTVGEWARAQVAEAYASGSMPALLPAAAGPDAPPPPRLPTGVRRPER